MQWILVISIKKVELEKNLGSVTWVLLEKVVIAKKGGISTLGSTYLMPAVKHGGLMRKRLLAESTILLSLIIYKRTLLKDVINTTPISPYCYYFNLRLLESDFPPLFILCFC